MATAIEILANTSQKKIHQRILQDNRARRQRQNDVQVRMDVFDGTYLFFSISMLSHLNITNSHPRSYPSRSGRSDTCHRSQRQVERWQSVQRQQYASAKMFLLMSAGTDRSIVKAHKRKENVTVESQTVEGLLQKIPGKLYEKLKHLPEHYEVREPRARSTDAPKSDKPNGEDANEAKGEEKEGAEEK